MSGKINFETVLILGASTKIERYSYKAVYALHKEGHKTVLIGRDAGTFIDGSKILDSIEEIKGIKIDTVSMYLNEKNSAAYGKHILEILPKRVIFNPGSESPSLFRLFSNNNIETINACTLVMLSIGTF